MANAKVRRRGVLLFSGGIDSTLAGMVLASEGADLVALSINYPGRPVGEITAARDISKSLPLLKTIEVSIDGGGSFTKPEYATTNLEGWIPYRNLLFWSIAAHRAIMEHVDFVAAGHHKDDADVFSDAGKEFFDHLKKILMYSGNFGSGLRIRMELPILSITNKRLCSLARMNKDLLRRTWSCWRNERTQCTECLSCTDRRSFLDLIDQG
jgi:7-cyano-7-deazaguanine synthase